MQNGSAEVAIIGAGVAGLEGARVLHEAGIDVVVLEARERIGGRIFTQRSNPLPVPIELGAEFVHGSAPELREIARHAPMTIADIAGQRWRGRDGTLRPLGDFWTELNTVMGRLRRRGPDRSFEQFLNTRPGGRRGSRARSLALQYVKGFHAADPERISEHALAEGGSPGDDTREQRMGRVLVGYDTVPLWIGGTVADRVRLGSVVTDVHWEPGSVRIDVRQPSGSSASALHARIAIITLPIGVLHAPAGAPGAVAFHPSLEASGTATEALNSTTMGAVMRVTLQLREQFWTSERFARRAKSQELDRLAFLHTGDQDFPVWWTSYPVSAPMLVAWCGGPRARELAALDEEQVRDRAVAALARQFALPLREACRLVTASWLHNWQADPFSRGAYSYTLVGGRGSPAKLARPVRRTLFFAGEASDAEGRTGTVHGAIATGGRAAKQVLRVL